MKLRISIPSQGLLEGLSISQKSWEQDMLHTLKEITATDTWIILQSFKVSANEVFSDNYTRDLLKLPREINLRIHEVLSVSLQIPRSRNKNNDRRSEEAILQCIVLMPVSNIRLPDEPNHPMPQGSGLQETLYVGSAVTWLDTYRSGIPQLMQAKYIPVETQQQREAALHEVAYPSKTILPLANKIRGLLEPIQRFDAEVFDSRTVQYSVPDTYQSLDQRGLQHWLQRADRFNPKTASGAPQQWSAGKKVRESVVQSLKQGLHNRLLHETFNPTTYNPMEMLAVAENPVTPGEKLELLRQSAERSNMPLSMKGSLLRAIASNSNSGAVTLLNLVDYYPELVAKNPALPMLNLEIPGLIQKLISRCTPNTSRPRFIAALASQGSHVSQ